MKWQIRFACLLLTFASCVLACEQVEPPYIIPHPPVDSIPDYREPYLGDFRFESHHRDSWEGVYTYYDTLVYDGWIGNSAFQDSLIQIHFRPASPLFTCEKATWQVCLNVKLRDGGLLKDARPSRSHHESFQGSFQGLDSISIDVGDGSLGGTKEIVTRGKRLR